MKVPPATALLPLLAACSEYELREDAEGKHGDTGCQVEVNPPGDRLSEEDCGFQREPGTFSPVVEWQWSQAVGSPGYDDVMMTPVVGDVDGDGTPEVVFTSYTGTSYTGAGALTILSGDSGAEEASWTNLGGYSPSGAGGVALGDLEGDGVPEIVVVTSDKRLLALHADGEVVWVSEPRPDDFGVLGYPVIADMDGDGLAEVVAGRAIFDHQGVLVGVGQHGTGGSYGIPVVVDLDMDGQQEVVVGDAAYRKDGSAIWSNDLGDGWVAVGDFDGDGQGDVVTVTGGQVYLLDTDGTPRWGPSPVPGGGGGPPTVADFDGDGEPEVGVAGYSGYVVFDTDGSTLWEQPTTDHSSARTGSSVFDFEGDGRWEVVYADELTLWIYDGQTGTPLMEETGHSSWTLYEYPVIVDVDADGDAEIVLASNDSINPGWQGITVIGDADGSWAPTTQAWNQHAYHITNVEDDLSIPASPTMNWEVGHNSFRAGGLRERPGIPAPNLYPEGGDACWTCADTAAVELGVQVVNGGTAAVEGPIHVALYAIFDDGTRALLAVEASPHSLAPGEASPTLLLQGDGPAHMRAVRVKVDDAGSGSGDVEECDEGDNTLDILSPC